MIKMFKHFNTQKNKFFNNFNKILIKKKNKINNLKKRKIIMKMHKIKNKQKKIKLVEKMNK